MNSREFKQIAQVLRVIYTESSLESRQWGSKIPYCFMSTSLHDHLSHKKEKDVVQAGQKHVEHYCP